MKNKRGKARRASHTLSPCVYLSLPVSLSLSRCRSLYLTLVPLFLVLSLCHSNHARHIYEAAIKRLLVHTAAGCYKEAACPWQSAVPEVCPALAGRRHDGQEGAWCEGFLRRRWQECSGQGTLCQGESALCSLSMTRCVSFRGRSRSAQTRCLVCTADLLLFEITGALSGWFRNTARCVAPPRHGPSCCLQRPSSSCFVMLTSYLYGFFKTTVIIVLGPIWSSLGLQLFECNAGPPRASAFLPVR